MKKFLLGSIFASSLFAQTVTFTMQGFACQVYGCYISPNQESDSNWTAQMQEYPPDNPMFYPSTHGTFKTGLNVSLYGYRSFSQIPTSESGTGSGTFNWNTGNGKSSSFTANLSCTWALTGGLFVETCNSPVDSQGQSVTFVRHWYATQGRYGYWTLYEFKSASANIYPMMTLTVVVN